MTVDFRPDEEDGLIFEYQTAEQRIESFRRTASPGLSNMVGQLYRANRDANPGAVVSAAQAVVNGQMSVDQANNLLLESQKLELNNAPKEQPGGFQGWINGGLSKLRTASRWTMATLNFVPQTVVNVAAQAFSPSADRGTEGWFISTDLGTLIRNDEEAGSGFFIGGKAHQLQAERARRYRGEIGGKAWTIGRGAANLIYQPGSREYNILSGFVDAVGALATPSLPGFQAAKGAAATQLAKAGEIGGLGVATRTAAGLLDAERAAIDPTKVRAWINSRGARQAIDKMSQFGFNKTTGKIDDFARLDEVRRAFPTVQDPQFWLDMVDAKSSDEIKNLLLDNLGKGVDDFDLSNRSVVERLSQRFSRVERLAASMPGQHIVLQAGNSRDLAASVRNMDNYLKLFAKQMTIKERQKLILNYTRAAATNDNPYEALEYINAATRKVMKGLDVPEQAIDEIMNKMRSDIDLTVHNTLAQDGQSFLFDSPYIATDGTTISGPLNTPTAESELMKTLAITLPDARKIRAITGDVGWLYKKSDKVNPNNFADPKLPLAMVEYFQNELWRPLTLMTPGYVFRNMADSAFRLSFTPGIKGGVLHPFQWIMIATNRKVRGSLTGVKWQNREQAARQLVKAKKAKDMDEARKIVAENLLRDGADEFVRATSQSMREVNAPEYLHHSAYKSRAWYPARRADKSRYSKGLRDQVNLLHDDRVYRRLAQGYDNIDQAIDDVTNFLLTDNEGREYIRNLQGVWNNRDSIDMVTGMKRNATVEFVRADGTLNEENVAHFVRDAVRRLAHDTGNNNTLIEAIATGKITDVDGNTFDIFRRGAAGRPDGYSEEFFNFTNDLTENSAAQLPAWTKFAEEIKTIDGAVGGQRGKIVSNRFRTGVNKFFSELYPRRSAYLMQSPVFRQFYYLKVANLIDELDASSVTSLRGILRQAAIEEGAITATQQIGRKWLADYVGDKKLAQKILDKISNPQAAKGNVTLDQLDKFAKGFALDETKNLFYNAAEKSNFADILRIVAPFGSAWAEVMNSWRKILVSNPDALRKVGVSVQGVRDSDIDNDGKGFFYKDPQTGEYVFNYPYSDKLGALTSFFGGMGGLVGLAAGGAKGAAIGAAGGGGLGFLAEQAFGTPGVQLTAPAKTLSMGLNFLPGLGPVAQIASSKILGQIPEADVMRKWMNPYGEPELTLVPSWLQKVYASVQDPENNRILGDLMIETMRALQATGNYDLTREDEKERLENDARSRARVLLFLRGLGQFTGPTRPTPEFKVETFAGDKMTAELSKAWYDFQQADYDNAVENFIATFGENAFLYMASKTKADVGGLSPTQEFGKFERDNRSLFNRYGDVAGYFAPEGTIFDYQVYTRFVDSGRLEKVRPSELIDDAQALVGKSIYRNVVAKVGPNPTAEQKEFIRNVRKQLYARYPGFQKEPVVIGITKNRIEQIINAIDDPILDNNPVAVPTRRYLEARRKALAEADARGYQTLQGKNVADLRGWLRNIADGLLAGYPEFERIYNRVLFNEIDVDAGE